MSPVPLVPAECSLSGWDGCDQEQLRCGLGFSGMRHLGCGQFQGERAHRDSELLLPRVQLGKTVHYLPILFIDQLSNRVKDLMVSAGPVLR